MTQTRESGLRPWGHLSGARRIFGHAGNGTTLVGRDSLYHFKASAEGGRKTNAAIGVDF
jgi:hypothetical protein